MVKMKKNIYQAPDPRVRVAYAVLEAIAQRCPPSQRAVAYVLARHENAQPNLWGANSANSELEEETVCLQCLQ